MASSVQHWQNVQVFIVSIDINDCEGNPCFPGGTCKDGLDSFTCVCECGYTGELCDQSMIDSCVPDPCIHGECKVVESEFFCECYTGYSGLRCEIGKSRLRKRLVQPSCYKLTISEICHCQILDEPKYASVISSQTHTHTFQTDLPWNKKPSASFGVS